MKATETKCDYCGKTKEGLSFWIGASLEPDWTMHEGTGKLTCPECYEKGSKEAQAVINRLRN